MKTPNTAASAEREAIALELAEERRAADEQAHNECGTTVFDVPVERYLPEALAFVDRILALSAPPVEAGGVEPVGTAEPQVGRAVYERIEKLVALNPKPGTGEWIELDYLSDLAESVEEVGGYDGPKKALSAPDPAGLVSEAMLALEPFARAAVEANRLTGTNETSGPVALCRAARGETAWADYRRADITYTALTAAKGQGGMK